MEAQFGGSALNQRTILSHPLGLFVLFFTEMWERFSYYGMRAILVLFLTSSLMNDGWAWSSEDALVLYGWYTGLVYLTPILGGFLADKFLGYRNATVLGAFIMTLGHASMALETFTESFFYLGLGLMIVGNGFFKPNISSIVGQLYKDGDKRKDGGYTIFYMGINAGAFLGILLCGYIGEKVGWHLGFGLAGIFMFFGMLQFWFAQKIFGNIGLAPKKLAAANNATEETKSPSNGFTKVEVDRLLVIIVFSIFTIFFWWAFEQAGGSMTIFAKDFTQRTLVGDASLIFKVSNTIITLVPMVILTVVLYGLFRKMIGSYLLSNVFLGASFVIIWSIVIWMINREFAATATEIPASWFSVLNSLFIILLAPLFSKIWASKLNPSGPIKFAIGLILLGTGFAFLALGAWGIPLGAEAASVSIIWLILAYLFHTMGELCVSPVGLSYVSKLAPLKLVGLMFGFWFVCSAIANYLGGKTGSYIDKISEAYGLSNFFLIFFIIPVLAGILMILSKPILIRKMHGIH